MKDAIKCICFCVVLYLAISYVEKVVSWKDTSGDYLSAATQLYSTDKNLIDVVFLGSSHVYSAINPSVIWEEYGISAFDMSTSGQDRESTYHYLIEVLKKQRPKVVCVDLYGLLFDRNELQGNVYRNMLSMKPSKNSMSLVKDYIEKEERAAYLLRWPIIHTRYRELSRFDFYKNPISEYGRGEVQHWNRMQDFVPNIDAREITAEGILSDKEITWINKLIDVSRSSGSEIVFLVAPFDIKEEEQLIVNAVKKYVATKDIEVFDFNVIYDDAGFDFSTDMDDSYHSNVYGARKLSSYLGKELSQRYYFTDHRGDSRYSLWDLDLAYNKNMQIRNELEYINNINDYINRAMNLPKGIIFISTEGDYQSATSFIEIENLSAEELLTGGKWIYRDGTWTKIMDNIAGTEKRVSVGTFDNVVLRYEVADFYADMVLGKDSLISIPNGINIAVYDRLTEELVSKKFIE